jgi:hypothetical protein
MARARSEALLALLLICAAFSAAAAAAGTGRAKGGSDHTEAPPCQDLATQGEWRREQVPVVPQRGARRHVLRGRRGVAPAAPGFLLRAVRRRGTRPEVMLLRRLGSCGPAMFREIWSKSNQFCNFRVCLDSAVDF